MSFKNWQRTWWSRNRWDREGVLAEIQGKGGEPGEWKKHRNSLVQNWFLTFHVSKKKEMSYMFGKVIPSWCQKWCVNIFYVDWSLCSNNHWKYVWKIQRGGEEKRRSRSLIVCIRFQINVINLINQTNIL